MAFIVLGHQRSGSSFVNELVRVHPMVEALHEPFSQHLGLFRETDLVPWTAEQFTADEEQPHPSMARGGATAEYLGLFRKWLHAPTDTVRGFKEVALFEKLPWLTRLLSPLSGILLARDARAVVNSVVVRGMHKSWWDYSGRLKRARRWCDQLPDDAEIEDPVVATALVWSIRMRLGLAHARQAGWIVVRLEDLIAEPVAWLEQVMCFIGAEPHPDQHRFLESSWSETRDGKYSFWRRPEAVLHAWKEGLSGDDQATVERIAGREMVELGYLR